MSLKPRNIRRASRRGYGLALLMIFISSSILVGASLQLMAGPTTMGYLGQSTQDNLLAKQVASLAINAAITDMQAKLNAGQTVDLSYRLPASGSTSVTIPTYPGSGSTTTLGSYYVTLSKARGSAFVLQVNATANSATVQVPKFIQMARNNNFILDSLPTGISAAYSVRRLRSGYTGAAIRVRRSSDNVEQDIGFTPNGDLDTTALTTFLGAATSGPLSGGDANEKPLDNLPAASAAYSLRKLRTAYGGSAVEVGRVQDQALANFGFPDDISVNVTNIENWLRTTNPDSSGRIKTWYDQTGNGRHVNQSDNALRPTIAFTGVVHMVNGKPAINFTTPTPNETGTNNGQHLDRGSAVPAQSINAVVSISGTKNNNYVFTIPYDSAATFRLNRRGDGSYYTAGSTTEWYYNTGTPPKIWVNGTQTTGGATDEHIVTATAASAKNSTPVIGRIQSHISLYQAKILELIVFPTALSDADRVYLEKNQAAYYGLSSSGGVGYITTWYDQSGNGRHAVQATASAQPEIMVLAPGATAIRPAVKFNGSKYLRVATGFPTNSDYSISSILSCAEANTCNNVVSGDSGHAFHTHNGSANTSYLKLWHNSVSFVTSSTAMPVDNPFAVLATFVNSSKLGTLYQGGVSVGSGTSGSSNSDPTLQVGAVNASYFWNNGTIAEAIIFSRVLSATERSALYDNQQSYFGAL